MLTVPPGTAMTTSDPELLQSRLAEVDERLAQIAVIIPHTSDYQRQELLSEQRELLALRNRTQQALQPAQAPSGEQQRRAVEALTRRKLVLDAMEAEQREQTLHFIDKLEREGDWRQARVHRLHLLSLRERLEALVT